MIIYDRLLKIHNAQKYVRDYTYVSYLGVANLTTIINEKTVRYE